MKRVLFVYNPVAGKGKVRNNLFEIVDCFVGNDYLVTLCPARKLEEAYPTLQLEEDIYDRIVCSGGDGTLNLMISFFMEKGIRKPIGYIPAGSTNDYAYSVGIPSDFMEAVKISVTGTPKSIDIGKFDDKYFLYVAAFGMFTKVAYSTPQEVKNLLGHTAYILEGMRTLSEIKSYPITLEYDGNVIQDEFVLGLITNSLSVGGFHGILPKDAQMDDGYFEMILIKDIRRNPLALNDTISALLSGKLDTCPYIVYAKTKDIKITSEEGIDWTLDGEYGGLHKYAKIRNLKQELSIITSAD